MSDNRRVDGERVFCHQCSNEWDRAQGGLTCPRCEGEFVEILSGNETHSEEEDLFPGQRAASPPRHRSPFDHPSPHPDRDLRDPFRSTRTPFDDHNPWGDVPDPDEGDISTFQFSTPAGGRGTFSFTSRTYTSRGTPLNPRGMNGPDMFPFGPMSAFGTVGGGGMGAFNNTGTGPTHRGPQPGDMQDLFSIIMQSMQAAQYPDDANGQRTRGGFFVSGGNLGGNNQPPPNPLSLIAALLRPGAVPGQHGDMVWSQEAFDRIVEQLAEQGNNAPPPASEEAIKNLPKKKMEQSMMGEDGKAECSICMDTVELGAEVTTLPCDHWFHEDCVVAWLKEHNTCPHCRSPISGAEETQNQASGSRRRPSRRSSSVASPFGGEATQNGQRNPWSAPDSPTNVREARMRFYGRQNSEREREEQRRSLSPRRSNQPEQHYGGRYESTDYYNSRPDPSRRQSGRRHSRTEAQSSSSTGGGVTGWIRNHLPGGGGSR